MDGLWKIILRLLLCLVGELTSLKSGISEVDTAKPFWSAHSKTSEGLTVFICFGEAKTWSVYFPLIPVFFSSSTAYRERETALISM